MMESGDEDIFAISDDEITSLATLTSVNPVEEHLLKQLYDVQDRLEAVTGEIAETKATTARILSDLEWRALYGENASSDSDNELYTVEGIPMVKKHSKISSGKTVLEVGSQWQCVLQDKWIIGVELINRSCCTLLNPRYYAYVLPMRDDEIFCQSTFWKLKKRHIFSSDKVNSIQPGTVVATMVLDLPMFDHESVVKCWGIISYEIDETQLQMAMPSIELSVVETIDNLYIKFLDENEDNAILALKSTCTVEKMICIRLSKIEGDDEDNQNVQNKLFGFLAIKIFTKVHDNIFLVKEHGSLMYCLVEIQSIDVDEASIRIFARSANQLNIILHLLQGEFSMVSFVEETDDCIEAATALIHELEMIRDKKSIHEIQEAKAITDLLIP